MVFSATKRITPLCFPSPFFIIFCYLYWWYIFFLNKSDMHHFFLVKRHLEDHISYGSRKALVFLECIKCAWCKHLYHVKMAIVALIHLSKSHLCMWSLVIRHSHPPLGNTYRYSTLWIDKGYTPEPHIVPTVFSITSILGMRGRSLGSSTKPHLYAGASKVAFHFTANTWKYQICYAVQISWL